VYVCVLSVPIDNDDENNHDDLIEVNIMNDENGIFGTQSSVLAANEKKAGAGLT
jgi:hypothetical protein